MRYSSGSTSIFPSSILDRSRMLLMFSSRFRPLPRMSFRQASFSRGSSCRRAISDRPRMALRGVRISWLMLARNWLLAWLAASAASALTLAFSSSWRRLAVAVSSSKTHRVTGASSDQPGMGKIRIWIQVRSCLR